MADDVEGDDLTYATSPLCTFMALETLLGIVLACLPTLRPAFDHFSGLVSASNSFPRIGRRSAESWGYEESVAGNGDLSNIDLKRLKGSIDSGVHANHCSVTSEDVSLDWMDHHQRAGGPAFLSS
ncbi:hypothetical protein N7540_009777 [Penicillium herquei]|nr:hypothetical protein N7540_009777 [Penicillium herquei]